MMSQTRPKNLSKFLGNHIQDLFMSDFTEETDYYTLLGCSEDCSQDALKKAYRRAAMKWHPDRNHGNEEEATRIFQLIEHAYSILSDDHERAWYDGHRNLSKNEDGEFQASMVDIMSLFHACAYIGFSEKSNGFYPVFRKAFATLAEEENAEAPGFGNADSSWEDVNAFYAFWTCFKTKRSFAFVDIYRLKDAPNAMYRRAMSKDNEKARAKAEKEFVASVRELASYVKKRDPRVIQHLKEIEEKRLLREAEEQARREAEKQKMLEELAKYEESGPKIEYTEDDLIYLHQFDNEDEENQIGKWSCPFCKREIKTESAFKAHCATKKHQKAANGPKRRFLSDPTLYEHKAKTYVLLCMNEDEIRQIAGDVEIDLNNLDDSIDQEDEPQNDDNLENEEEEDDDEINKQKGKKKQLSKKEMRRLKKKEENMAAAAAATNKKAESQQNKKQPLSKKEKRKQQIMEEKQRKLQMQEEEHKAKLEMKQQKNEQRIQKELEEQQQLTKEFIEGKENEQEEPVKPEKKLSKKEIRKMKQKQALEEMNKESNDGQPKRLPKNIKNPPPGMFMCRKCRLLFPSRKKLFDHLNESGHAIAE